MKTGVCSIIGYKGRQSAAPIIVDSLKRMEYRGYDSVGVAMIKDGSLMVRKGTGKVAEVSQSLGINNMSGLIGIGHTRWATHGGVTDSNAHPHSACKNNIAVVHNGIIENYRELKEELTALGHVFSSETDSEVIAHLLEAHGNMDVKQAIIETCKCLRGSYAFVAAFQDGTIAGARYEEPLIVGVGNDGYFVSSDVLGFLQHTDKAIFLDNCDIVIIDNNKMEIFGFDGMPVARPITQVAWELGEANKGKYAHYTLKEINDQRLTMRNAARQDESAMSRFCDILSGAKNVYITGSGTSYHAALIFKQMLARFANVRAEAVMSSEAQDGLVAVGEDSVIVAISQSGETADVLASVKMAKAQGAKVLAIANVTTSSLARSSDCFLSTNCGPEIGVAATKSFTGQLAIAYAVTDRLAGGSLKAGEKAEFVDAADKVISMCQKAIEKMADELRDVNDIYLLGRSIHYPIVLEGALKLKELAYVHAEGVAAGEIKHGPLALMEKNTLVMMLSPKDATHNDSISNAHEIKSRGATIVGISDEKDDVYDHFIEIPHLEQEAFYPIIEVIPLQMLAYYLALAKDADPDYPRNLAKSVTVK